MPVFSNVNVLSNVAISILSPLYPSYRTMHVNFGGYGRTKSHGQVAS